MERDYLVSKETGDRIIKFRDERNWKQYHTPKDLAISLSLEAAELLEIFQWSGEDTSAGEKLDKVKEELADVLSYCILMADVCGLDLDEIMREKIDRNAEKYPVELAYGSKEKYTELKNKSRN
ncbi:MAG: nucleotide pyrophosphohydrolase [Clostridia bacterium]|nr:nucleotide pyrophosphohydrolase [Clostridia bacterium]